MYMVCPFTFIEQPPLGAKTHKKPVASVALPHSFSTYREVGLANKDKLLYNRQKKQTNTHTHTTQHAATVTAIKKTRGLGGSLPSCFLLVADNGQPSQLPAALAISYFRRLALLGS
jgi:hypothetical protein